MYMEPTLVTQPTVSNTPTQAPILETPTEITVEQKIVYPWARHVLLIVLVLLALVIILSLIYLNGKSIYQYGV